MNTIFAALSLLCLPAGVSAQNITEERVQFSPGSTRAAITSEIVGDQIVDYLLEGDAGQQLDIIFAPDNLSANFNLLFEDNPEALHIGPVAGPRFSGVLPNAGDYRIRVFLMRSAARRNEAATYSLDVSVGVDVPALDFADGLAGGPDRWQVFGIDADSVLNIRNGPSTNNGVLGQVSNGTLLTARDGCVLTGVTRWCAVTMPDGTAGWAAGRFLREPPGQPDITGSLPCATRIGEPMASCDFRATRGAPGTASVWIVLPQGGERYVAFVDGTAMATDAGLTLTTTRIPEISVLQIGDAERYEIPDAIIFGG